jgi:hypothetical protein
LGNYSEELYIIKSSNMGQFHYIIRTVAYAKLLSTLVEGGIRVLGGNNVTNKLSSQKWQ